MIKTIAITAFLVMLGWNLVENFMSVYLSDSLSNAEISAVFISIYLPFSIFSILSIALIRKPWIMISLGSALYSPFMVLIATNPSLTYLVLSGILVGMGASLFFISCSYYVLMSENRGRSAGIFSGSASAGSGLAGLLGGYALMHIDFQILFLAGAAILLTGSLLNYLLGYGRTDTTVHTDLSDFLSILRDREVIKIGMLTFLGILFFGVSKSFVPIVTRNIGGTVLDVGIYTFTLVIFSLVVAVVGGSMTDRIGRKFGFYTVMVLSALCSFIVSISKNVFTIFIAGSLFSFVNVLTRTVSLASMGDYVRNSLMAGAVVLFYISLAATFSLLVFGVISDIRLPFMVIGFISLASTLLVKKLKV